MVTVGSLDAWLGSANIELPKCRESSVWARKPLSTTKAPSTTSAPYTAGNCSFHSDLTKGDIKKTGRRLSLLTAELRDKQAKAQSETMQDTDEISSQGQQSWGYTTLLPRAMSDPQEMREFNLAECKTLSSPLECGALSLTEATCNSDSSRVDGGGYAEYYNAAVASDFRDNDRSYVEEMLHPCTGTNAGNADNKWSGPVLSCGVVLDPSISFANCGGFREASPAFHAKPADLGISAIGSRTSEKRNTYERTVRGGHPRTAVWRLSGCGHEPLAMAGDALMQGPWGVVHVQGVLLSRNDPQQRSQRNPALEPLPLADMLRNALHRR